MLGLSTKSHTCKVCGEDSPKEQFDNDYPRLVVSAKLDDSCDSYYYKSSPVCCRGCAIGAIGMNIKNGYTDAAGYLTLEIPSIKGVTSYTPVKTGKLLGGEERVFNDYWVRMYRIWRAYPDEY